MAIPLTLRGSVAASPRPTAAAAASSSSVPRRLHLRHTLIRSPLRSRRRAPALAPERLSVRCAGVATIVESEFEAEVLGAEVPVLVEFFADWCGPCRLVTPFIDWASKEYKGRLKVVKIDHDANPQLIKDYKVYGLPALILFSDGQEVPGSRKEGAISKAKLKVYLDSLLESKTVA